MAIVIYDFSGIINYEIGITLFLGMLVGGRLGALVAVEKGNAWVKTLFVVVVIVLIIVMISKKYSLF